MSRLFLLDEDLRQTQEDSKSIPSFRQKHVLIADDSVRSVAPVNLVFQNLGCRTILCFDGSSCVQEMTKHDIDLLVLDWQMPDFTGGQALRKIEELFSSDNYKRTNQKIPVILYSATALEDLILPECPSFDILTHWRKPFTFLDLTKEALRALKRI